MVVMLTSHALNADNFSKSYKEGAASYIPKEEMINITTYLNDILEAKKIERFTGGIGSIKWKLISMRN